ncbi:MAG: acyltransferase family protein [Gallionella sp.]
MRDATLDSLVRVVVPLFVMLSGSLLLKSVDHPSVNLKSIGRRIGRVLLPLLVWSLFYLWWVDRSALAHPVESMQKISTQPAMYHLWFVYMIIGLYILQPILQVVFRASELNAHFEWYFVAVWLIVNSVTVYVPLPFIVPMQISTLFGYGGYFIIGGLLNLPRWLNIATYKWGVLYLSGVLVTFFVTWLRTNSAGVPDELAYSYFTPNVFFAAVGAFMLLRKLRTPSEGLVKVVQQISDASFLIYFVHVLLLEFLRYGTLGLKISTTDIHPAISIPLLAITTFVLSTVASLLVRVIPSARRVLG